MAACSYTFIYVLVYLRSVFPTRLGKFQKVGNLIWSQLYIQYAEQCLIYIKDCTDACYMNEQRCVWLTYHMPCLICEKMLGEIFLSSEYLEVITLRI